MPGSNEAFDLSYNKFFYLNDGHQYFSVTYKGKSKMVCLFYNSDGSQLPSNMKRQPLDPTTGHPAGFNLTIQFDKLSEKPCEF